MWKENPTSFLNVIFTSHTDMNLIQPFQHWYFPIFFYPRRYLQVIISKHPADWMEMMYIFINCVDMKNTTNRTTIQAHKQRRLLASFVLAALNKNNISCGCQSRVS